MAYNSKTILPSLGDIKMEIDANTFNAAINNLSKAGLVMWLYFMAQPDGEQVIVNYCKLKEYGINADINKKGLRELIKNHYLVQDNIETNNIYTFYPIPQEVEEEDIIVYKWQSYF